MEIKFQTTKNSKDLDKKRSHLTSKSLTVSGQKHENNSKPSSILGCK